LKILIAATLFLAPMQAFASGCVPDLTTDCDGDGVTIEQGDCDDLEKDAAPGKPEQCEDEIDNNCDGFYDEGCDVAVRQASIQGGGGCTGGDEAVLLFFPLLLWGRRTR